MSDEKIGVWVCECGGNIGDIVETQRIVDAISDEVSYAQVERYLCSKPSVDGIKKAVEEKGLDRVILACCTPKMHWSITILQTVPTNLTKPPPSFRDGQRATVF